MCTSTPGYPDILTYVHVMHMWGCAYTLYQKLVKAMLLLYMVVIHVQVLEYEGFTSEEENPLELVPNTAINGHCNHGYCMKGA